MPEQEPYTPSVEAARESYAGAMSAPMGVFAEPDRYRAEFDRMIAAVRREATLAERERAARIAEYAPEYRWSAVGEEQAKMIAAVIREEPTE